MNTLRVISRLNVGGPARHVTTVDTGLRTLGYETHLVYGSVAPGEADLESLVATRGLRATKIPELGRRISPIGDLRAFARLLQITFEIRPDVIHTHAAKGGTLGRLAALCYNAVQPRRRRALVLHTFHGHVFAGYFGPIGNVLARWTERAVAAMATDRVITISEEQRCDIVERFGVAPAGKVVVVPLGIELAPYLTMETPADWEGHPQGAASPHDLVFGFAGRFVPIKDLETLIRAFALTVRQVPHARLLLAGDGPLRDSLQGLAAGLGVTARVEFAGWREPADVLRATDIAILSSRNEGTPLWLIEAMAAGRPAISTRVGGVPDIVEDGVTGLLAPAGDVEALAHAMMRLAREPEERRRMGVEARVRAAARFGGDRLVRDLDSLYRAALAEKRAVAHEPDVADAAGERVR